MTPMAPQKEQGPPCPTSEPGHKTLGEESFVEVRRVLNSKGDVEKCPFTYTGEETPMEPDGMDLFGR